MGEEKKRMEIELEERKVLKETGDKDADVKVDPFDAVDDFKPIGAPWEELNMNGKLKRVSVTLGKIIALLLMLYLFICSLSFLSSAFRLLGGKAAGSAFSSNGIVSNPVAGLMMGVVATVLLQSSSTTTSIVVSMVAADILEVSPAIPIVMGANIGTSVTNTIVAIGQIADKDQFRRAFAGATVHDMFNILSVIILLPIEVASNYLFRLTKVIIESMHLGEGDESLKKELLSKLTKPFTSLVIQLDKKIIESIAKGDKSADSKSLIKYICDKGDKITKVVMVNKQVNETIVTATNQTSYVLKNITVPENQTSTINVKLCKFIFHDTGLSDTAVGAIMLVIALVILCVCLVLIVKTLHSLLRGQIAVVIRKTINSDFPKPFGFLTGYFAILVGAGMTILVQSSSIFTSALTPLVGLGIISLNRVYPLTLGANIGTTGTGILAALASSSDKLGAALQIALCHLFFNISGILIWYPIPTLRKIPIKFAKYLGNTTAKYRWFAIAYLVVAFFIFPGVIFGLSLAGWKVFVGITVPVVVLILVILVINLIQYKRKEILPKKMQTWNWVPEPMKSLEPYDKVFGKVSKFAKRRRRNDSASIA